MSGHKDAAASHLSQQAPMPWLAVTLMFVLKDSTVQTIALRIARSEPLDRPV